MCFQRTYSLLETIEAHLKQSIPFKVYARGCHLISEAATRILTRMGYDASSNLIAFQDARGEWVPHYVVMWGSALLDFKQRVFGNFVLGELRAPIRPAMQLGGGFYCDDRVYKLEVSARDFLGQRKKNFLEFLLCNGWGEDAKLVDDAVDKFFA